MIYNYDHGIFRCYNGDELQFLYHKGSYYIGNLDGSFNLHEFFKSDKYTEAQAYWLKTIRNLKGEFIK